ncbi:MAG: polysaccharide export protein [Gammaproteobacteria bacterium]|nr:polysaccharide export protein [Gammaproteobacteria bacterium]
MVKTKLFSSLRRSAFDLRTSLSVAVVGLMLAGCAADGPARDATESNSAESTEPVAGYGIGPGDSLQIFVWGHTDLSTSVLVRPDGRISTPLVEDLQAAGRTPTQLARDIEGVLREYVRTPVVTVIMQGFVGEGAQQVRVVGQALSPQALQFRQGMTVLDVMIEVGGLSEFAAGNRAKIVRKTGDGEVEIKIRLDDLLNDGDMSENVHIRPGDVLIIPQSFF